MRPLKPRLFLFLFLFALLPSFMSPCTAEEISIPCTSDNTLYEDREGNIGNSRGQHLFVGKTLRGPVRRALLAFDLGDHIPADATISNVELLFAVSQTQGGAQNLFLQRVLRHWGEGLSDAHEPEGQGIEALDGDATWLHAFYPDSLWSTPGGDFATTASASLIVDGGGTYIWESTPKLVSDVQGWLDTPQQNFGWAIVGNEVEPKTAKRIFSREHETAAQRPQLRVSFERTANTLIDANSWAKTKNNSTR